MKVAEAQKSSGTRLLDVFDIHWYPSEKDYESRMNWHRVLFDTTYNYPGANGIKNVTGKWDNNNTKEFIFKRISDWLNQYFGEGHGITLGITETSLIDENDPMVTALTYASFIGTMQENGVEIFTPWTWNDGMYEVLHLFSRYGHANRVQSISSNDSLVSAYSSITNKGDSLTVVFVNRAEKDAQDVQLKVENFNARTKFKTLTLAGITGETFVSHTKNALKEDAISAKVSGGSTNATTNFANKFTMALPAKSITAVLLTTENPQVVDSTDAIKPGEQHRRSGISTARFAIATQGRNIIVSSTAGNRNNTTHYALSNVLGQVIASGIWNTNATTFNLTAPHAGKYILRLGEQSYSVVVK